MADHVEIRPDDASLPLTLADIALRNSNMRLTYLSGTIAVDNGDGTHTIKGVMYDKTFDKSLRYEYKTEHPGIFSPNFG